MRADTKPGDSPRVLILGGTSDASQLAERLADTPNLTVISSLAGRVNDPRLPAGQVRVGGFGGASGLTRYLVEEKIHAVIDATHPYAAKISASAESACATLGLSLIAFERPPWMQQAGDRWHTVVNPQAAASFVDSPDNNVFLSIGRQELNAFSSCSEAWFLVRAIDQPEHPLPTRSQLILARGPFQRSDEVQTFREHSINVIVSKNSGGPATYAKIEAARELRIPVVMIDRPRKHSIPTLTSLDDVLHRLTSLL